ncbi:MAG: hypothetical protein HYR55_01445 [Acidobacteria bacterium]|nr:hypothetical protein [Acidobacteriota bacterium]MBI3656010.1 hypothetical protein [Acidobacteriota bacterium]
MKRYLLRPLIISMTILCAIGALTLTHEFLFEQIASACGVERWSVKVGTDADRYLINLSAPSTNTIATMITWPYPQPIPRNNRVQPYETTVWVLTTTLVRFKAESDEDFHLVLSDAYGNTMIAEIPAPNCVGGSSPLGAGIANARAQFLERYTPTTRFQTVNVPVRISGVGMFDFQHGQSGAAPNQIELHPVLDIVFNPGNPPDAPASLTAVPGDSQVSLSWTSVSGATSYSLYRATTSGGEVSYQTGLTTTDFRDTGVVNGTTYYYVVTALNAGGESAPSPEASATPVGGGGTVQVMGNPGFENGASNPAPWVATPLVISNNPAEPPHSGSWKAWLDGFGQTHTDTLYQPVSLPATATTATLNFWLHIDTAETTTTIIYDTLEVQIQDSAGGWLTTLATYSNLDAAPGYFQQSFDVSTYIGQTIRVFLIGREDYSNQTSFVVDDFELNVQ